MRKNLEKNELKINKWIDLIFGSLQRGEKAEENHNIFMAQSYENMVKIDTVVDYDSRNALMRLAEVGITPKQLFKNDTKPKSDKFVAKGYLFQTQKLFKFPVVCQRQEEITKKLYTNKSINKEYKQEIYSKIIKIKSIGPNELLLLNNLNYLTRLKFKGPPEKLSIEEKIVHQALNISSKYSPSYSISEQKQPIIFYNNNKYMIKGGFWDGRLEINSIILDSKEKEKHFSNCVYINEGPIVVMEMTKDEKILLCGTKTGFLICFSVNGHSLSIKNKIYIHNDEITSININDNLNMFATSSLDGYINLHILPSFDLIRSIKISICNLKFNNYGEEFYYANNVFLSSCPLPCVTAFISTKKIFRTLTINGEFIEDREEDSNFINCPILFNDLNFQDYIIY
jgi:WD40 repeat protein